MSSASELLRTGLRRIQRRFSKAADSGLKIQILLIESTVANLWTGSPPSEFAHRNFLTFFVDSSYGPDTRGVSRSIFLYGPRKAHKTILSPVIDAGNLFSGASNGVFPLAIPRETLTTTGPEIRWYYILFDFAWAKVKDSALRPLKEKTAWAPHRKVALAALPAFRRDFPEEASEFPDPPLWYSVIDDVAQASVYAIDILLLSPVDGVVNDAKSASGDPNAPKLATPGLFYPATLRAFQAGASVVMETLNKAQLGGQLGTAKTEHDEKRGTVAATPTFIKGPLKQPRKRGRPVDTDPKEDKRIYEAWKTGRHKTYADCDRELGLTRGATYSAVERHRKRLERKEKKRRTD